ncbi:cellulase family glycosylhydrolase [Fulvivirga ligni]|uniref:cellulase family glycosylhydrolase n=1 Tax=Fulvivirga ligni TaxID=2904246 RepID=UPI001F1FA4DE|nr:cellulase family glycosylhydrolase [Fulvivirga ligni]UII19345.1 cellulase family glycosylhydrolase [Fulvivirga ligni]
MNFLKIKLALGLSVSIILMLVSSVALHAQNKNNPVYVDKEGIIRWTSNNKEAAFFGVNYTLPFAYGYRSHQKVGLDIKSSIDQDVYHLARLGFDAFRVHVWDTEISDSLGNLKNNEHLELYDYLIAKLKERHIKIIVTPIAFWGNGYPEPDEHTHSFSDIYNKQEAVINEKAFQAQENYLKQFFKHKNRYTGLTFQEDHDIIATEINNEPKHSGKKARTTEYVNRMAAAVRSTGWTKPVFYNISESPHHADGVAKANVDGFSFQWYPTGLVANHTLESNFLPNVDVYAIPFDTIPEFHHKARMVYEFDAGDVLGSYMYPAMAKSFRGAGFQWATQFAYDPLGTAYANTEYQTHYVNLAYTPKKAISLMIAGKAFHQLPRSKSYGSYPADSVFGDFKVSYKQELSEMNSQTEFYYSNNTKSQPKSEKKLKHIAGVGSSPIINYSGTGAYFLDKIDKGIWRLEVMPDAIFINDPFAKASLEKEVTRIQWQKNAMAIHLTELGYEFSIRGLNEGNSGLEQARDGKFSISPGTYLIYNNQKAAEKVNFNKKMGVLGLSEFVAPKSKFTSVYLKHESPNLVSSEQPLKLKATVVGLSSNAHVSVLMRTLSGVYKTIDMVQDSPYEYSAEVPADILKPGVIKYRIAIKDKEESYTYPGGYNINIWAWDNYHNDSYSLWVSTPTTPVVLFDAAQEKPITVYPNLWSANERSIQTTSTPNELSLRLSSATDKSETLGFQTFIRNEIKNQTDKDSFSSITIKGRTSDGKKLPIQITLITKDGYAFSASTVLNDKLESHSVNFEAFKASKYLLLPRPYPGFHPLWFTASGQAELKLTDVEKLEIRTIEDDSKEIKTIEIATVLLQR